MDPYDPTVEARECAFDALLHVALAALMSRQLPGSTEPGVGREAAAIAEVAYAGRGEALARIAGDQRPPSESREVGQVVRPATEPGDTEEC